jgi:hypothetical protein
MCSEGLRSLARRRLVLTALAIACVAGALSGAAPKFYPDDPIAVDRDTLLDVGSPRPVELSEAYDFIENTYASPGDARQIRALNVNTLDEVPDSSWFTNRIGSRPMTMAEIARGPDKFEKLEVDEWVAVAGKPTGFQPGFRAIDPKNPGQIYQLEVDSLSNPELATGAEMIGTIIYHALGYNVVDNYLVYVDRARVRIGPNATIKDARGRRRYTQRDLDDVFRLSARQSDGRYRMLASRFAEGTPVGNFRYFGTRSDDPNDVFPHEHRRELRANRVFAAWLNHDDSRAINTLDMLVTENGKKYIKHYMFDFGSILGSATRFADDPRSGHEYLLEGGPSIKRGASFGLYVSPWQRIDYLDLPPSVGRIQGDYFDPPAWRAEYANRAFLNMRPDDAFWGARRVAAFTDDAIRTAVGRAAYSDPRATDYLTGVLIKRRNAIARVWLNGVNPLVNLSLDAGGTLTFENAAVAAGAATSATGYALSWGRFDNAAGTTERVGSEITVAETRATLPAELARAEYVSVAIRSLHPDHPAWATPLNAYFRRDANGWTTVGLERE